MLGQRGDKAGGVLGVHHADDEIERAVVPAGGDIAEDLAGQRVVAAVEPQFPAGRNRIDQRPASQQLQPRRPVDMTQAVGDGFSGDIKTR